MATLNNILYKTKYSYLPTAGEMKWLVLELYFGGLGYGR